MKVFIVNGAPCAGKTTFENFCKQIIGIDKCRIISSIDFVKSIATECGWDGTKTLENRKFLSDLKDLLTKWNDVPFKKVVEEISICKPLNVVFFVDCREPLEIEKLKNELGATTIFINNTNAENSSTSNHADQNVKNYSYDIIIDNNGTIEELFTKAKGFCKNFI